MELHTLAEIKCPDEAVSRCRPRVGKGGHHIEVSIKLNEAIKDLIGNRYRVLDQRSSQDRGWQGSFARGRRYVPPMVGLVLTCEEASRWLLSVIPLLAAGGDSKSHTTKRIAR